MTQSFWLERRTGALIVALIMAAGAISYALYYPATITVRDEGTYMRQARLLARGDVAIVKIDPFTQRTVSRVPVPYPIGTALAMSPFIALFGWRGGFVLSFLCFAAAVAITARWLHEEGRPAIFALVVAGFPAAMVISRVSMSDTPSLVWGALGLWLFWRGLDRGRTGYWLAAGFVAGASLTFRESNVLLFLPLFVGCVVRRDSTVWALVVGGLVGVSTRLVTGQLFFGDPFIVKWSGDFSIRYVLQNLPLHALALLAFVPGGLIGAAAYRGRRRPEIIATVALFVGFYLTFWYSAAASGPMKRLVLAQRYLIPLLPVLAFAMAESVPRFWRWWMDELKNRRVLEKVPGAVFGAWVGAVALGIVAVHPVHSGWAQSQAIIRSEINSRIAYDSVVITNWNLTGKFFDLLLGRHFPKSRDQLRPTDVGYLIQSYPEVLAVMLDRTDSASARKDVETNASFMQSLPGRRELLVDRQVTPTERLRIWRLVPL